MRQISNGTLAAASEEGRRVRADRSEGGRLALQRAVIQTVAYADVFDYPLTTDEIQRYLVGLSASRDDVRAVLACGEAAGLSREGYYFTLHGRESIVETRRARAARAADYWRRALRYGHTISTLPFVRMVAVTGGLAMDNMSDDDIDYLIVTEPGRLWLCRAMIIGVVRLAARLGTELCPNYFLSERALVLAERNLFTAHEVAQMVPLAGISTYERLRDLNRWTEAFLPNASGAPVRLVPVERARRRARRIVEGTLRSSLCSPLESWEMRRKIKKLGSRGNGHAEAAFGPDWCKGHFGNHGLVTLERYAQRLRALGHPVPA